MYKLEIDPQKDRFGGPDEAEVGVRTDRKELQDLKKSR
jgi:hypothetical protein